MLRIQPFWIAVTLRVQKENNKTHPTEYQSVSDDFPIAKFIIYDKQKLLKHYG